jgi:phosphoribosylformylglycinamidine cyclo-ligase
VLPIFHVIQECGAVPLDEMYRVFNMGIGMVVVVAPEHADAVVSKIAESGDRAYRIGEMVPQAANEGRVEYVG